MTREEAICRLIDLQNGSGQVYEAIRMAIEALSSYDELYEKAKEVSDMANEILADFPSYKEALTKAEWIPCSERLPNESGDYICTIPLDADETYTEVLMFHKGRFYEDDDEWGATYYDDVLAWMPLPKPYRPQGEWIFRTDIPIGGGRTSAGYVCSICGKDYFHGDMLDYCPNCGARMENK